MSIPLTQIPDLVGKLDDTPGDHTPSERFRHFLRTNVAEVGALRDRGVVHNENGGTYVPSTGT